MAKILIVHGISNQFVGEMQLRAAWYPALCDGLNRVGHSPLPDPDDCFCPFYGDLFRPTVQQHLGGEPAPDEDALFAANQDETALLRAIWSGASAVDPAVPGAEEFTDTLVWTPRVVERALNALARSEFLADYLPLQFFGDLKQVVAYMKDPVMHQQILSRVLAQIAPETRIVIGHSLGSVVAYEAVCAKPAQITTLITLGSPLGIRNVVFDKLTPTPRADGLGVWPGAVKQWTNVAARGDIVAAQKTLAPLFGDQVEDVLIDSGWDAHSATRYLNAEQAGSAVAHGLNHTPLAGRAAPREQPPWHSTY